MNDIGNKKEWIAMKKVTLKNGRELLIRKATVNDVEEMAKFKMCISGESDFLSFGKGELEITPETERKSLTLKTGRITP